MHSVGLTIRPLSERVDKPSDGWHASRFQSSWSTTVDQLQTELARIRVSSAVLEIDVAERDVRQDGWVRAGARPTSPAVRLCFEHPDVGPLIYPCNTYLTWQSNVRAIVKTMEAQRAMDRYGATRRNEQYRGWAKLPPGPTIQQAMTLESAYGVLGGDPRDTRATTHFKYREAARKAHPDTGGSDEQMVRVSEAWRVIREAKGWA